MTTEEEIIVNEDINESSLQDFKTWDSLELNSDILRGVYAYGFDNPSPIQSKSILPIINGKDIIGQAQSGTGKTATFTIGALQRVNLSDQSTQVLILSPTRELSTQTAKVVTSIGTFMDGLKVQTIFGGSNYDEGSIFSRKNIPHIICGCPGRVYDMMRKDKISSKTIKLIILDEADEMLSAGFKDQVYNIFQYLDNNIQVLLFSATIPDSMSSIISKIMRNPIKISVKKEQLTLEGIKQVFIAVDDDRQKYITLKNLFSNITITQSIIYCNSIKRVDDLFEAMIEDGFPVCKIHSTMDKSVRDKSFNDFKSGSSRVLISSNVTARGIDIQQVSIVINFDVPKCVHTYLHRIGRSGRWGRKGVGINFITRRDVYQIKKIEEHYSTQISEMPSDLEFLSKL
jgi:translation initiation factor 4A